MMKKIIERTKKIFLEKHSNAMKLSAYQKDQLVDSEIYYFSQIFFNCCCHRFTL